MLAADLRFAVRSVVRDPLFALIAASTIALGVGATTAVFSIVNAVLIRPLPVPEPDRVVAVEENRSGAVSAGMDGTRMPFGRYVSYRDATRDVFENLAAHRFVELSLRLDDRTVPAEGVTATGNYFDVLAVRPAIGRFFTADDDREVVLSYRIWRDLYDLDPGVVGRSIALDGTSFTVVGVAPASFLGTTIARAMDFWIPLRASENAPTEGFASWVAMIGRLKPGVDVEAASALVNTVGLRVPPDEPQTRIRYARLDVVTGLPPMLGRDVASASALMFGLAMLVLLIASANIGGMMLSRGFARRRELAIRLAMGAGGRRVIRHLLAECLLVFGLGGVGGIGLAWLATGWLERLPFPLDPAPVIDFSLDLGLLAIALALTLGTGLLFGLAPALQGARTDLVPALKDGALQGGARTGRWRAFFVTAQMAMSVLLLLIAGLFTRSLRQGLALDPGFRTEGIVAGRIDLAPRGYDKTTGDAFFAQVLDRVRATPGVEGAALSNFTFLEGALSRSDLRPDEPVPGGPDYVNAFFDWADPSLFDLMEIEVVAGRGIGERDVDGALQVVVISEELARRMWPGQSPIGKRLRGMGPVREVVGVVRDGRFTTMTEPPRPMVFIPQAQDYRPSMAVHIRAPGAEGAALHALEETVRALDPDVAVADQTTLTRMVDSSLFLHRFASQLVGVFGLVGLVLAATGLYGVLAFNVAHRTRELAVRRALGADGRDVLGQVARQGGLFLAVGAAIGVAGGAGLAMVLRSFLIGIRPLDPVTFVGAPLVLLAVAALASIRPAVRALSVEPTEALRQD